MGRLNDWVFHRAKLFGLSWPQGIADAAGIGTSTVELIAVGGNLRGISRSARGYLARVLKVSVRDLEALASGRIEWIDDTSRVDLDRLSPQTVRAVEAVIRPRVCPAGRGVPIMGRILDGGLVEHFAMEEARRLAVRYSGAPDAFALECTGDMALEVRGDCLVFRVILPGELREGERALITCDESELRIVHRPDAMTLRLAPVSADSGAERTVALCDVVRAARIIDVRSRGVESQDASEGF